MLQMVDWLVGDRVCHGNPLVRMCRGDKGEISKASLLIDSGEVTPAVLLRDGGRMLGLEDLWLRVSLLLKAFYKRSVDHVLPHGKRLRLLHEYAGIEHCQCGVPGANERVWQGTELANPRCRICVVAAFLRSGGRLGSRHISQRNHEVYHI
jgi:hypothetical protein